MSVREDFAKAQSKENRDRALSDPYRLSYHIMPPVGWLNDPNGLYEKDGVYHIFYQYSPGSADGSTPKGWGHYSTKDFITFEEEEVPLFPDQYMDAKGAYSGSAFPDGDTVHFFYTGNNKLEGDHDYINSGRIHWTNHFTTKDGKEFTEKETLLKNEDYPEDMSNHVRDPKIIKEGDTYYMVLGARSKDNVGQILVFESKDLKNWKLSSRILPEETFGFMWECPDVFDLDEERILITCPQGVDTDGIKYENVYQNGYFLIDDDLSKDQKVKDFAELDNGFDFYAPQTFLDENGRRILIGWMGLPDAPYHNPKNVEYGWQHALTLPRRLEFRNGRLYQYPIEETLNLREKEVPMELKANKVEKLPSRVCEINLDVDNKSFVLKLRKDVTISWDGKVMTLSLGESGEGRDARHLAIEKVESLQIFSDVSSLEIFVNKGEHAFTTRLFDEADDLDIESDRDMKATIWTLKAYTFKWQDA